MVQVHLSSPVKSLENNGFSRLFLFLSAVQKAERVNKRSTAGQQMPDFRMRGKEIMASIKVNKKDGKIVSFKFRVFIVCSHNTAGCQKMLPAGNNC